MTRPAYSLHLAIVLGAFVTTLDAQSLHRRSKPSAPQTLDQVLAADATLRDVTFVDAQHGWAVGDRGVVLATEDGGVHWHSQSSGVECPLLSVSFVDDKRGWIVGGRAIPITHRSEAVLLRTFDGGATWQRVDAPTLPRLTYVKFFDAAHGVAAGYGSSFYPSGLFVSRDGGKSWQPLPARQSATWLAGSFVDPSTGFVAGAGGARGLVFDRQLREAPLATTDSREPRDVCATSPTDAWMVGRDGLALHTTDSGTTWQPPATPPLQLPGNLSRAWQWNTVAVRGTHVWMAGMPGSAIAHSADGGTTWTTQSTGQSMPIEKLTFLDQQRGWAVGALGTVLATDDGGRTWRRVRGGGRAAMLSLAATQQELSLEIAARYAAGEGYRTTLQPLFANSPTANTSSDEHRLIEAIARCGGDFQPPLWAGATPPLAFHASSDDLLAELHRVSDGLATEQLLAKLVLAIRTWRPDVIQVPHQRDTSHNAASAVTEQLVREAIVRAADPTQQASLAALGLGAWQVKRTVGLLPPGQRGTIRLPTDDFVPTLGGSPASRAAASRGLLHTTHTLAPPLEELELLQQVEGLPSSSRDLFAGLPLMAGSDARRVNVATNTADLDRLRRLNQKRGQLVRLLDYAEGSPVWSAQVVQLTGGLESQTGGELLFQLAEGYRETGRHAMAADTLYLLARRYPQHPLGEQALRWLVQYYASGEIAHVASTQQAKAMRAAPLANVNPQAGGDAPLPSSEGGGTSELSVDGRLERATALGDYLSKARPAMYAEPDLRFPLAVASRKLGFDNTADRYFTILAKQDVGAGWSTAAGAENWLAKPEELPPNKPTATCKAIAQPPHLDGELNEPFWQKAQPLRIATTAARDDATAATVLLTRDEQYFYVAIRAPKLVGEDYPTDDAPRSRDADLSALDRIELAIDVDRDYSTAFELAVDCRGWTHDACWGDATWNPQWYVAARSSDTEWTVELAIPWKELAEEGPAVLDAWCLSVVRQTSRGHAASWSGTVGDSPNRYGLLLFR